jgi:tetratricopeptide (TPR) repeat protein
MITELGRLNPRHLGVIARTSSMAYKGTNKSASAIARELGVDYVLEGSVRREADRVRIVAQLIRASDQTHVWAERYDRDVRGILALQSELAVAIATQMRMQLPVSVQAALDGRGRVVHPDAHEAYLRGRFFLNRRTGEAFQKGVEQFEHAIALDPSYAQGYAGLADAHELAATYAGRPPRESLALAMAAARKALELDPALAEAHTSVGLIHGSFTWEWLESERAFLRAIELNASDALAHKGYSEVLSFLGRHDEAIAAAKRSVALDPLSVLMQANLGITYYRARRYDEAVRQMRRTLDLDPHYMLAHLNLGMILSASGAHDDAMRAFQRAREYAPEVADGLALLGYGYARQGRTEEARQVVAELRRWSEKQYVSPYPRAAIHVALGEWPQALADLEQAYDDRSWLVGMLKVDPMFDPLRGDERFERLVRKLNLTDEQ